MGRDALAHRYSPTATLYGALLDQVDSYDPRNAIDDFLDRGGSFFDAPERQFPERWTAEAVKFARAEYLKPYNTQLRAAELGVSRTYRRHQYAPSWNACLFPECAILQACGELRREGEQRNRRRKRCPASRPRPNTTAS